MKILKKAKQKNIVLDKDYYTVYEINEMLANRDICYFKGLNESYQLVDSWEFEDITFRVFTDDLKELKVICEDGYYKTVAIGKNEKMYYITL